MTANLIEGLEKAEGPSRELDYQLSVAFGLFTPCDRWKRTGEYTWHKDFKMGNPATYTKWSDVFQPKHYTASIDAALTLVPEGDMVFPLVERTPVGWNAQVRIGANSPKFYVSRHQNPAIAICIAALRARENDDV